MNQFAVLAKKELVQMVREIKVVWFPLVFILLGITQPLVNYYMPTILEMLGAAQGISIDPSMMAQSGGEVLAGTLGSQFDQLGVIIIVISLMGIVQSDKTSGMLAFILTRPVKGAAYLSSKVLSHYLFIASSVTVGYIISYLYTHFLFTSIPLGDLSLALILYLLWVLFIVLFTTMISTFYDSQGVIALVAIVFLLGCRVIAGLNPFLDIINPASLSTYAMELLVTGVLNTNVVWSILIMLTLSALVLNLSNTWISKKKYNVN
jgi:ABC-2 type transport system permease protein